MKNISTLLFVFAALVSYSQISLSPNNGCPGSSFQITITGSGTNTQVGTPCSGISGVFSNGSNVIAVTNPVQASAPFTVSLNIPANFTPGNYDFQIVYASSGNCYTGTCASCFTVTAPVTSANIVPAGNQIVCQGDSISLRCVAPAATSFEWKANGAPIIGSTDSFYVAKTAALYTCTAINTCGNFAATDTANVMIAATPSAATLVVVGPTLKAVSPVAIAYEWYFNGSVINGQTDSTLTPAQTGNYSVKITDVNGCSATTSPFAFTVTGIKDIESNIALQLIPNPASGFVTISGNFNNGFTAYIVSIDGRTMDVIQSPGASAQVDVSKLSKGIYMVKVKTATGEVQKRLTIQ